MTNRRPLAISAAAVIGFSGLLVAAPAMAETGASEDTPITIADTAPVAEISEIEAAGLEVVSYGVNADGEAILITVGDQPETTAAEAAIDAFAEKIGAGEDLIIKTVSAPLEAYAPTDIVGGAGYLAGDETDYLGFCSIGFNAWSAASDPIALSAGHCTNNGAALDATMVRPSTQPGNGAPDDGAGSPYALLGFFGFSQFGGIGNAVVDENDFDASGALKPGVTLDENATDIAVIENIDPALTLLPEVTDWSTADSEDLAASTLKVKSAGGDPVIGTISKSGRTTGYTTGAVAADHLIDGWAIVEDRWVRGFQSNVVAAPGDSGGAVFQPTADGVRALGVISGGSPATADEEQFTWTASLKHAMPHLPAGTEVALDIDAPSVTGVSNGGSVPGNAEITITVAHNATGVTVNGTEYPVANGQAIINAPSTPGDHTFEIIATNGKSSSATTTVNFAVELGAPTVNNFDIVGDPAADTRTTITGTGAAGAVVTIAGDISGTTTVDADGNWAFDTDLTIATYEFTVSQELNGQESVSAAGTGVVRLAAPAITSIANNAEFANGEAPVGVSGTGIAGAEVTLIIGDATYTAIVDDEGNWTVEFSAALAAGDHSAKAIQAMGDMQSAATTLNFTVAAAPSDGGAGGGAGDNNTPGNNGSQNNNGSGEEGALANTGAASLMPLGVAVLTLLALGGTLFMVAARRRVSTES